MTWDLHHNDNVWGRKRLKSLCSGHDRRCGPPVTRPSLPSGLVLLCCLYFVVLLVAVYKSTGRIRKADTTIGKLVKMRFQSYIMRRVLASKLLSNRAGNEIFASLSIFRMRKIVIVIILSFLRSWCRKTSWECNKMYFIPMEVTSGEETRPHNMGLVLGALRSRKVCW